MKGCPSLSKSVQACPNLSKSVQECQKEENNLSKAVQEIQFLDNLDNLDTWTAKKRMTQKKLEFFKFFPKFSDQFFQFVWLFMKNGFS